jgi:hypothetical protein
VRPEKVVAARLVRPNGAAAATISSADNNPSCRFSGRSALTIGAANGDIGGGSVAF